MRRQYTKRLHNGATRELDDTPESATIPLQCRCSVHVGSEVTIPGVALADFSIAE